jgi:prepilin-type N-terminal cleavage/methylation domain-containing protein
VKRRGFTLLELLVVIGIIAVLSGLLIMGVGKLITSGKRQQTQMIFQTLQAMYSEYDAVIRPTFPAANYPTANLNQSAVPCPQNVSLDYYNAITQSGASPAMAASSNPLADRYSFAVLMTRDYLALFRSMPKNAAAMGKIPNSSITTTTIDETYSSTAVTAPAQFNTAAGSYVVPQRVWVQGTDPYGNTIYSYYTCIQNNPSVAPNPYNYTAAVVPTSNTSYWIPSTVDKTVPVVLDAWNNPILFVPSGSLGSGVALGTGNVITPGVGTLEAGNQSAVVNSPDGRPFWASAGPDGDFSKGDDNMYSFEK